MKINKNQTFFVVGETSLAAQCVEFLLEREHCLGGILSDDPWLREWAREREIPLFDTFAFLPEFDYLLSIVNPKLIPEWVVRLSKKFAINYHDSLLPAYAGVHATSWAILNKEKIHGITWHMITEQVDGGDVLKQSAFSIASEESALTLNIKCYQHAFQTFKELILELEKNRHQLKRQDLGQRTYFGAHKKPKNAGVISWDDDEAHEIETLFRALDFGNYPNKFCLPKLFVANNFLFPKKIQRVEKSSKLSPGTVVKTTEFELQIATKTQDVLLTLEKNEAQKTNLVVGERLPSPVGLQSLEKYCSQLSRVENFWVKELQRSNYLNLGCCSLSDGKREICWNLSEALPGEVILTTVLIYLHRISQQADFTVNYRSNEGELAEYRELFVADVPLNVSFSTEDTFARAQDKVLNSLKLLKDKRTYLKDLPLRYPQHIHHSQTTPGVIILKQWDSGLLGVGEMTQTAGQ